MTDDVLPSQVRAARALLAWSQADLAKAADVGSSTVADFERGQRQPVANNVEAMRLALEAQGVRFISGGAVVGQLHDAIRTNQLQHGNAIRWIEGPDLSNWAATRRGQEWFPELIKRLLLATYGHGVQLDIPSGNGVARQGPDGISRTSESLSGVPSGTTVWEFSTQAKDIKAKAEKDYARYQAEAFPHIPVGASFIFVTAHPWGGKDAWAHAHSSDGRWSQVIALDGEDVIQWLEKYPSVAIWLAVEIGKCPPDLKMLSDAWEDWSLATRLPLSSDLVLAGRDEDAKKVMQWLKAPPSVLSVQAESQEEAVAFLHAALSELPADISEPFLSHAVVVSSEAAAKLLGSSMSSLIIALADSEVALAQSLARKGHRVYLALGPQSTAITGRLELKRPKQSELRDALLAMAAAADAASPTGSEKLSTKVLEKFARDASQSLTALRRLLPPSLGSLPSWARPPLLPAFRAALLIGGWDAAYEPDRRAVETMAGMAYEDVERQLMPLAQAIDSPLRKAGTAWKLASPRDALILVASQITPGDVSKFSDLFIHVLKSVDPNFVLDSEDRWHASLERLKQVHSDLVRRGLVETAILFSIYAERLTQIGNSVAIVDNLVRTVLHGAGPDLWWSLSEDFMRLAEASPDEFLAALDHALSGDASALSAVLLKDETPFFGREYLSGLLWALEVLAWSPQYILGASESLANLADIDRVEKRGNTPMRALRQIFLPWFPQTSADVDQRFQVIDRLIEDWPNQAWQLLLSMAPRNHDFSDMNAEPRWRDFSDRNDEEANRILWPQNIERTLERLLANAGRSGARWSALLDLACNVWPEKRQEIKDGLLAAIRTMGDSDKAKLRQDLRSFLHKHRQFARADWALPEAELVDLQRAYDQLEPADPIQRISWLFDAGAGLPNPAPWDDQDVFQNEKEIEAARQRALDCLIGSEGVESVFALAAATPRPAIVGEVFAKRGRPSASLLEEAFQSSDNSKSEFGMALFRSLVWTEDRNWSEELVTRAKTAGWSRGVLDQMIQRLRGDLETWRFIEKMGKEYVESYWKSYGGFVDKDWDAVAYAVPHLIAVGRGRVAVHVLGAKLALNPPSAIVIDVLDAGLADHTPLEDQNDAVMFGHYVAELLNYLDGQPDVHDQKRVQLDWNYFGVLQQGQRPPKHLETALASDPAFFVQLLEWTFRPAEGSGVADSDLPPETRKKLAEQSYRVLGSWAIVPGSRDDGEIDFAALKSWVTTARKLAAEKGRLEVGDRRIGEIFSASLRPNDKVWPPAAIAKVLESTKNDDIESGLILGALNRRGATVRAVDGGGALERDEAERFRQFAAAYRFTSRRTAAVLDKLARSYDAQAQRADEQAEQNQWRWS